MNITIPPISIEAIHAAKTAAITLRKAAINDPSGIELTIALTEFIIWTTDVLNQTESEDQTAND